MLEDNNYVLKQQLLKETNHQYNLRQARDSVLTICVYRLRLMTETLLLGRFLKTFTDCIVYFKHSNLCSYCLSLVFFSFNEMK